MFETGVRLAIEEKKSDDFRGMLKQSAELKINTKELLKKTEASVYDVLDEINCDIEVEESGEWKLVVCEAA